LLSTICVLCHHLAVLAVDCWSVYVLWASASGHRELVSVVGHAGAVAADERISEHSQDAATGLSDS
jgi:hypothetical protein